MFFDDLIDNANDDRTKKLKANHHVLFNRSICWFQSNICQTFSSGSTPTRDASHLRRDDSLSLSIRQTLEGYLKGFVHVWLVPACCLFFPVEAPCYNGNQPAVHLAAVAEDNSRRKFTGLFGNFSQHRGGGSSQFPKLL